uniref:Uncharacterized protein n=1 Tax=Lutzomyia longipalpis TaxID=7200 RepID=A0A1B0CVW6_LUTLO
MEEEVLESHIRKCSKQPAKLRYHAMMIFLSQCAHCASGISIYPSISNYSAKTPRNGFKKTWGPGSSNVGTIKPVKLSVKPIRNLPRKSESIQIKNEISSDTEENVEPFNEPDEEPEPEQNLPEKEEVDFWANDTDDDDKYSLSSFDSFDWNYEAIMRKRQTMARNAEEDKKKSSMQEDDKKSEHGEESNSEENNKNSSTKKKTKREEGLFLEMCEFCGRFSSDGFFPKTIIMSMYGEQSFSKAVQ